MYYTVLLLLSLEYNIIMSEYCAAMYRLHSLVMIDQNIKATDTCKQHNKMQLSKKNLTMLVVRW